MTLNYPGGWRIASRGGSPGAARSTATAAGDIPYSPRPQVQHGTKMHIQIRTTMLTAKIGNLLEMSITKWRLFHSSAIDTRIWNTERYGDIMQRLFTRATEEIGYRIAATCPIANLNVQCAFIQKNRSRFKRIVIDIQKQYLAILNHPSEERLNHQLRPRTRQHHRLDFYEKPPFGLSAPRMTPHLA